MEPLDRQKNVTNRIAEYQAELNTIDFDGLSIKDKNVEKINSKIEAESVREHVQFWYRPRRNTYRCRFCSKEYTSQKVYLKHKEAHETRMNMLDVMFCVLMVRSTMKGRKNEDS